MTDPHREELILRYITGKLPSDVALRARTYLDETSKGHVVGIGLRQVMAAEILEDGAPDARISLAQLLDRLDRAIPHFPSHLTGGVGTSGPTLELPQSMGTARAEVRRRKLAMSGTQPLRREIWTSIAALALGVVLTAIGWNVATRHSSTSSVTAMSVYTTGKGQRATITLPDGNTVALNVASHLEVPADYTTGDHTVRLVGEGLFDITHRDRTPFTVIAGSVATRVLGTRFVVRHYTSDSTTVVAVQNGRVAIRSVVLTAAQQLEILHSGVTNIRAANPALYSFASGVLVLNGVRLSHAIPDLDRWYDADIRLGDSTVASRRMTAALPAGSLSDLTEYLQFMFNVRVIRDGRVLTLLQR